MTEKLLSGRYFLTIIGGMAFLWCAINRIIEPQTTATILTMIFISYFQRDRNGKEQKQ